MFKLRPFEPTDAAYAREAEIHNALWPDEPTVVESLKYKDETQDPEYLFQKLIIELDDASAQAGTMIGLAWYGENSWSYVPGRYYVGFNVDPSFRHFAYGPQGVGNLVMDYFLQTLSSRQPAAELFTTHWREDRREHIAFLESHGFEPAMRYQDSELNVAAFAPGPFQDKLDQVKAAGINIVSLTELKIRHSDWLERLYDLDMELLPDEPSTAEFTAISLDEYAKVFGQPALFEDCWLVALDGDRYVGHTNIWKHLADPKQLITGFTGVRRKYRRTGVATVLKIHVIQKVKALGVTRLIAGNEENNPMYQINVMLGFKPLPGWLELHKKIEAN